MFRTNHGYYPGGMVENSPAFQRRAMFVCPSGTGTAAVLGFGSARWFLFLLLCLPYALRAHDPGLSTATVVVGPGKIEATLGFSMVDAGQVVASDQNRVG